MGAAGVVPSSKRTLSTPPKSGKARALTSRTALQRSRPSIGEPSAYVKEQLGHHSIHVTVDTYGHLIPGANREAVNRLAAMIENAPLARLEEKPD